MFLPPIGLGVAAVACFSQLRQISNDQRFEREAQIRESVRSSIRQAGASARGLTRERGDPFRRSTGLAQDDLTVTETGSNRIKSPDLVPPLPILADLFTIPTQGLNPQIEMHQEYMVQKPLGQGPNVNRNVLRNISQSLEATGFGPARWSPAERSLIEQVFVASGRLTPRLNDVFLSYAHKDGAPTAASLVSLLRNTFNVSVWFDRDDLRPGEGLASQIDGGMTHARIGVALVTSRYLEFSHWIEKELNAFHEKKVLIPVLDGVTHEQMSARSALLGSLVALEVKKDGALGVAAKITAAVKQA